MAHEDKVIEEIEEDVKFCYLAQHKELPAKELIGIVSKMVTTIDATHHKRVYHIVVSISKADYERITSREDFAFA